MVTLQIKSLWLEQQHHPTHDTENPMKDRYPYQENRRTFESHKLVRNTRTQTSPQESVSSEDSLLQTPLPRKRPPVPAVPDSYHHLSKSRPKGRRFDVDMKGEKKPRVHFEPDVTPTLPSYTKEMTDKGRGLVRELASQDSAAGRLPTTLTTEKPSKSSGVVPIQPGLNMALSSEVVKIKNDLKDILTETEKLKQELWKHQPLKEDVTEVLPITSRQRHVGPSPLDEYLEPIHSSAISGNLPVSMKTDSLPHYTTAERILRDVQHRREILERNFEAVLRQREENDLYNLVDSMVPLSGEFDEMIRIRRQVDKRIGDISATVKRELNQEKNETSQNEKNLAPAKKRPNSQPLRSALSGQRKIEQRTSSQVSFNKGPRKQLGKENVPQKLQEKKSKLKTQVPSKRPALVTPAQTEVYMTSVYGRQPYHPQRTTSKAPYLHYQSPVNPKTAAIVAGLLKGDRGTASKPALQDTSKPVLHNMKSEPEREVDETRKKRKDAPKASPSPHGAAFKHRDNAQYYFHPRGDLPYFAPEEGRVAAPLEGQLLPMAIPLGKPKTNPALRPPIPTQEGKRSSPIEAKSQVITSSPTPDSSKSSDTPQSQSPVPSPVKPNKSARQSESPVPSPVKPNKSARPNVAVITVYDKELGDETAHQYQRRKKSSAKNKKNALAVQVLPTMDIDSFSETASSSQSLPFVSDIPDPLSRPDDSDYQEFRNFLAVTETGSQEKDEEQAPGIVENDNDDELHRIPTPQHPLTLEGFSGLPEQSYNGPPFPPVHPAISVQQSGGVIEAESRQVEALRDRAMEWIEQELLARMVSEMNQPASDPTTLIRPQATPESSTGSEPEDDDADMLAATIGLGGVQLFVDAGLPVDRDLVTNLIREVIAENVSTILGHPKPRTRRPSSTQSLLEEVQSSDTPSPGETPIPTPTPTPEYTPPESEESAHESAVMATPVPTPTSSVTNEEPTSSVSKQEENVFELVRSEQENEVEDEKEACDEMTEVNTPVATPLATPVSTPTPVQSPPASIKTPEPSEKEPESSEATKISTPAPSIVVKTPTSEPGPEPEVSLSEGPSQFKESSVSQKELTPPKPTKPSVSSPSSFSSTTIGTVTITTTDEELSEGELIQPYAHAGIYSEGEFAVSPSVVQLAAERNLPIGVDWDTAVLGKDQDSRNELVKDAVSAILDQGDRGKSRDHGNREYSTSSDSLHQVSSASTLRDTESIKEDYIMEDREPGEIRARDPMAVLLSRIQSYRPPVDKSGSERDEISGHLHMYSNDEEISLEREPGEIVARNLSPGEVVTWKPSLSLRRNLPTSFQRKISPKGEPNDPNLDRASVAPEPITKNSEEDQSHDDSSLHASDLLPEYSQRQKQQLQQRNETNIILVKNKGGHSSETSLPNTYSVEEHLERPISQDTDLKEEGLKAVKSEKELTKIQVTLPTAENNLYEESATASEARLSADQDTFGDLSSISGGDF
ncbi:TALPID3 protein-like isoform X2 [Acropora millepora]|uniref:TALPID3 protein-like isoform X2 n=1 Tax=Acropora millepora TaxID=45264 RepID=UPI001CF295B7|nr:TALPID3 protein-like isoform X2 [Acropora millepora]